jgi:hypothetical protein
MLLYVFQIFSVSRMRPPVGPVKTFFRFFFTGGPQTLARTHLGAQGPSPGVPSASFCFFNFWVIFLIFCVL